MSEDQMRYDVLAQDALRQVVRKALDIAADQGLPGDHHFYISFKTTFDGVEMSDRLRAQYPEEMTVVIQHQFWNLDVTDERFTVELTFNKIPEKLTIPFAALQGFYDPSVQFGLQFTADAANADSVPQPADVTDQTAPDDAGTNGETNGGAKPAPGNGEVVSLDAFRKK